MEVATTKLRNVGSIQAAEGEDPNVFRIQHSTWCCGKVGLGQ